MEWIALCLGSHWWNPHCYCKAHMGLCMAVIYYYYYFKMNGFNIIAHAIVDCNKMFIDGYMGLSRSINDCEMLMMLSLYEHAQYKSLLNANKGIVKKFFPPCILGDKGHHLILWIATPSRKRLNIIFWNLFIKENISEVDMWWKFLSKVWRRPLKNYLINFF